MSGARETQAGGHHSLLEYWPCKGLVYVGGGGVTVHLGSFGLGEACVATRSLQPFSLGGQFPAVQSDMATLRDTQLRPYSPGTGGLHKGPRERKGHCLLLKTEDSCLESLLEPQDGTVQVFSLMGSMTSTGCCPPVLWAIKSNSKEKLQPPTLAFSPGAQEHPASPHSQAPGGH